MLEVCDFGLLLMTVHTNEKGVAISCGSFSAPFVSRLCLVRVRDFHVSDCFNSYCPCAVHA